MKSCPIPAAIVLAASLALSAGASVPDLVPMPKEYEALGGELALDGLPVFADMQNRQSVIAAGEIGLRIQELGGTPAETLEAGDPTRPGMYVLPFDHAAARALAAEFDLAVSAGDPGPQGYVIHVAQDRIAVIGSDAIGTLYGAMTLRQMMRRSGDGGVSVDRARVRDKPDFRYRSRHSYRRSLRYWSMGAPNPVEGLKAGVEWMARFKNNIISDYFYSSEEPRDITAETRRIIAEVNAYAAERGIYPMLLENTRVGVPRHDEDRPEFRDWECVYLSSARGQYYCWSRDELTRAHIARTLDLVEECGFRILFVHPVDGGGPIDPELWSRRCRLCRERFGDRRWEASVHQFNLWASAIRERNLDIIFTMPIYPYNALYASLDRIRAFYPNVPEDLWRRNSLEYWSQVHTHTDPMVMPLSWMALPEDMAVFRATFEGRPLFHYAHSIRVAGYFGSWHRLAKTNYVGRPDDIFYLAGGTDTYTDNWLNSICSGEFAWNTEAPGAASFTGWYYDLERDHTGPPEVMQEWVPRAVRAFFGEAVGSRMAAVYNTGIQHRYIMDPGQALAEANRARRRPAADVDPGAETEESDAPEITDSADRMNAQVEATRRAMGGLKEAYGHIDTLDPYRRRSFLYFYRRMPIWHMIARARHAVYRSVELERDGRREEARAAVEQGIEDFGQDLATVERVLDQTRGDRDIWGFPPFHAQGRVRPLPEELRAMLDARRADFEVTLAPRAPGDVIRIGLYEGFGAQATKAFFDRFTNVRAEIIDSLALSVIERFDCLFIFQTRSLIEADYFGNLPRYVREGGRGVLFQHDLLGMDRAAFGSRTPFPGIVPRAADRVDAFEVVLGERHPATGNREPGTEMRHMYYDHRVPELGPEGRAIVFDRAGNPVVAIGEAGLGKVVFDGNVNIADADEQAELTGFNAHFARHVVEWFTGVTLRE